MVGYCMVDLNLVQPVEQGGEPELQGEGNDAWTSVTGSRQRGRCGQSMNLVGLVEHRRR